ncbi:MAG: hypothetical protein EPO21_08135 [Chloroflexota bacterium]|nr:MAG: hypothetical protein EPO21_08135 [Chloroflexota bacterium]
MDNNAAGLGLRVSKPTDRDLVGRGTASMLAEAEVGVNCQGVRSDGGTLLAAVGTLRAGRWAGKNIYSWDKRTHG